MDQKNVRGRGGIYQKTNRNRKGRTDRMMNNSASAGERLKGGYHGSEEKLHRGTGREVCRQPRRRRPRPKQQLWSLATPVGGQHRLGHQPIL